MRHSPIVKLIGLLLIYPLSVNPALSRNADNLLLGHQLEAILNQKKHALLKDLFLPKSFKQFDKQYLDFSRKYKDAKWSIKTVLNTPEKTILDIKITSTREVDDKVYNLNAKQRIKIVTFNNKIKSYEVIYEDSILHSDKSPLIIKIVSPDKVLTGEKYEMNLIIEKPLDNSLIASGMIVLNDSNNTNISNDLFGIKLNQSGGLFKYVQAPLEPGYQTISAIITHPKGIYSITKKIKVSL